MAKRKKQKRARWSDQFQAPRVERRDTYRTNTNGRHAQRLRVAVDDLLEATEWCQRNDVGIRVRNQNGHWLFNVGDRLVEWWPASAKLVIDHRYEEGIHTHSWDQVALLLETLRDEHAQRAALTP